MLFGAGIFFNEHAVNETTQIKVKGIGEQESMSRR